METNLDDARPEVLGENFQQDLLALGARDFYFTSIQMKKGRPGLKVSVLCDQERQEAINAFLLEHTPSIGVRHFKVERTILDRRQFELDTPYGKVDVKAVTTPSGENRYKIEYESLRKLKELHKIPILKLEALLYPLLSKIHDHEEK